MMRIILGGTQMKRTAVLCLLALFLASLPALPATTITFGQEPKPPEPQDKRGIGLEASPTPTPAGATQNRSGATKPEIVLQAGITSPQAQLAFSPDGRLLASMGIDGNAIKLWDIASGRQLRQLESGIPSLGTSSAARPFRFSADGKTLIAFAQSRLRRWDVDTGRELNSTPILSAGNFISIRLSDDARTLSALALDNQTIRLWDTNTGRVLNPVTLAEDAQLSSMYSGIALSPDGRLIATLTRKFEATRTSMQSKEELTVWDTSNAKKIKTVRVATNAYRMGSAIGADQSATAVFSPDSLWVAVRIQDNVKIFDVSSGAELKSFNLPAAYDPQADSSFSMFSTTLLFSPDKQKLAVLTDRNQIVIVDTSSPTSQVNLKGHTGSVVSLSFSRDGKLLASSGTENQIKLWDVSSGKELTALRGAAVPISDIAFSRDGRSLSLAAHEAVSLWELTTGGVRRSVALPDDYSRSSRDIMERGSFLSPDGRFLMAGSDTQSNVKLWDVQSGKEVSTASLGQGKTLANAVFTADSNTLVVMEGDQQKPKTNQPSAVTQMATDMQVPDTTKLMERMKKDPKGLQEEMKRIQEAVAKGDLNAGMTMMQSLGMLPTKGDPNPSSLRYLETTTGRLINAVPMAGGFFNEGGAGSTIGSSALSFSPDGRILASARGYNSPVRISEVSTGKELRTLKVPFSMGVNTMAWSPDGKRLASAQWGLKRMPDMNNPTAQDFTFEDMSFAVRLWDPETGAEISSLAGHNNFVVRLAFSADSRVLASGSFDSTIKLWDVNTGRELRTLSGHTGAINALAFSPDGRFVVSGSDDGSARLWKTETGELLATLASINQGKDWLVVTPSGLFDGSPGGWNQILWRFSPALTDVSPVEIFFNEYFHPGLLTDILEGKKLAVAEDISQKDRRQPTLSLTVPEVTGDRISTRNTKLIINISNAPAGAQDVRLFRNGSLVRLWRGDVLKGQPNVSLEAPVNFIAGKNEFRAYAFNRDNVKSSDAVLSITGADSLKRPSTLHLIVAGVNQYTNAEYNLKYAVADAGSFAEELARQQKKLNQYQQIRITSLLDQNATKANLLYALNRLAGNVDAKKPEGSPAELETIVPAEPEDSVVLFFAGHGTAQQQRFFLIPHDMGYQGKRTELDRPGLESILSHSISDLELEQAFVGIDAGMILMVIDACNSGQALEAEEKRRGPMNSKGLAQLGYEKGMYIMTAAQSYQAALEAAQLGHGYLTYALVEEGLKAAAADTQPKDGQVVLREWLDYATERVPQMQEEKMRTARGLRIELAFVEGEEKVAEVDKRNVQRPRVFYRREPETQPLVVAKP